MGMELAAFAERLRAAGDGAADRWTACSVWAGALVLRHTYLHPVSWEYARQTGGESEAVVVVAALTAAALHQAAERTGVLHALHLPRAAAMLADAPTAVSTIAQTPPAPPSLQILQDILDGLPHDLADGDTETRAEILYVLGLAHQVLTADQEAGPALDQQMPELARAMAMSAHLTDEAPGTGPYAEAMPLRLHDALVRADEQMTDKHGATARPGEAARESDRLLRAAALADRWLLAWGPENQPAERVHLAEASAMALVRHDRAHRLAAADADPGEDLSPRMYVRRQYAIRAALRPGRRP